MRLKQSDTVLGWQSHSPAIVVSCIQNYSNCRLRQIPEQERVKPGVQQFLAIADKATQPEQPCAIYEYRTKKDRDRCSNCRSKSFKCLNYPPGNGRCKCEAYQVSACGTRNIR